MGTDDVQQPDTKPGAYYVSARDGPRHALCLGPFVNDHAAALARVEAVRRLAADLDPRAHWFAFGTCRLDLPADLTALPAGRLNRIMEG